MPTSIATFGAQGLSRARADQQSLARYLTPLGRAAFTAIFLPSAVLHFNPQYVQYAAASGVPLAPVLVPLAGVIATAGGLSVLLGYRAKLGAWLLVLFLIPVTLTMHAFWKATDPTMAQMQYVMFMKNVSMLGGALLIAQLGSGPLSLDGRAGSGPRPGA